VKAIFLRKIVSLDRDLQRIECGRIRAKPWLELRLPIRLDRYAVWQGTMVGPISIVLLSRTS
jgi:hypothetical protein